MADTGLVLITPLMQTISKAITSIQAVAEVEVCGSKATSSQAVGEGEVCGFKATAIQADTGLIPPFTLASLAPGLQEKFAALAQSLTEIQPVAEGAEGMQEIDPALKSWLQELNDAVNDAVDLLDECGYDVLEMKNETPGLKLEPEKVDGKLSEINGSLAEIRKEVDFINLMIKFRKQKLASAGRPYHELVPILDSSEFVGREDDVSKMVDLLDGLRSKHRISGISVVGVAGVGKTTVAKLVYMKAEEGARYDVVAWFCVSEEFTDQRILGEMMEYFNISYVRPSTVRELLQDLGNELENKTFLLILDDVQEKDADKCYDFLCHLSEVVKSNRNSIVLTTRSEGVVSVVGELPMYRYDMQRLSDDQCWMIMKKLVLSLPSNAIGHSIAKQCGGLPLVATAIGETMNSIEEDHWLAIARNREWKLENRNSILSVLKQSFFDCVPSRLKKCFSYCSIFPEGFEIRKDDLIQLWMAGGFLQQSNESSMTMEDIGNKYLNELVSNSLFQYVRRDACGNVESYKMLDLVHDLSLFVSKGETSIWNTGSDIINFNVRNLRIKYDVLPGIPQRFHLSAAPQRLHLPAVPQRLHSLFLDGYWSITKELNLKSLRSLKLVGTQIEELPISLDKSKHLRYLEIAESTIKALPESLSKLQTLQTLKVMQCNDLKKLPDDTNKLDNLSHLYFDKVNLMPKGIGHLTSLQTLPIFFVRKEGFTIEELGCLSQLRGKMEIQILDSEISKSEAISARLNEKTQLHEVVFVWKEGRGFDYDEEVLEGLQPHSNLRSLSIINYHHFNFPSWIDGLSSLQQLKIESCHWLESLPKDFRKLHSLSVVDITNCGRLTSIPEEWLASLTSLKELRITDCSSLTSIPEEWLASLTCLKELRMGPFCTELFEFPGLAKIHHLHASLESLTLNGWPKLVNLPHQLQHLTTLKKLHIKWFEVKAFPRWFGDLSVKELRIGPLSLRRLLTNEFPELTFIFHLPSLERLELREWHALEFLRHQLPHFTALKELVIRDIPRQDVVGEWLGNLSPLRELNIMNCDLLLLPSVQAMRCLSNLQSLIIEDRYTPCPEWEKISHIPNIRIEGQTIQSQQHYNLICSVRPRRL